MLVLEINMILRKKKRNGLFLLQQDGEFIKFSSNPKNETIQQMIGTDCDENKKNIRPLSKTVPKSRLKVISVIFFCIIIFFVGRLVQLQIISSSHYQTLSTENRQKTELIVPLRGVITDRNGILMAWNEPVFELSMRINELPKNDTQRNEIFTHVADLCGLQPTDLDLLYSKYFERGNELIKIIDEIPYETAIRIATQISDIQGFIIQTKEKRIYASGTTSLSHVIGYVGLLSEEEFVSNQSLGYRLMDEIGKTGIEQNKEKLLRGVSGKLVYEVDSSGAKRSIISKQEPINGSSLRLSIDMEFQSFAQAQLEKTLKHVGATRGAIIAIDPRSGAVRLLISIPAYDNNEFIGGISDERYQMLVNDLDHPLFPRAIAGEYPSGSIFKPFIAYAALADKIISEHTSFLSSGGLRIGQWFFPDWRVGGHGMTDVRKAIADSVNTFFYIIGGGFDQTTGLGVERINYYANLFGFGSTTGIDLSGEADGFLPTKEWKQQVKNEQWYVGDTYHLSIGQGDFLTTPIQMAVATSIIANGGKIFVPYLVETIDDKPSRDINNQVIELENLDSHSLSLVRQGMRQTVTSGSAKSLLNLAEPVAGKTGTAQTPGDKPYHSWFIGFGPYDDPTINLVVLIEEGGESNKAAVPLAKELFSWWFAND